MSLAGESVSNYCWLDRMMYATTALITSVTSRSCRFSKLLCRKCQSEKREGLLFLEASCSILDEQEGLCSIRVVWDVEFIALTVRFVPLAICKYTSSYPLVCLFAFHESF